MVFVPPYYSVIPTGSLILRPDHVGDFIKMALPNDFEDSPTWGSVSQTAPADILRDAMRKEAIIK